MNSKKRYEYASLLCEYFLRKKYPPYYLNKKKVWVEMYGSGFEDYGMTGAAGVFATGSVLPVIPGTGFFTPVRVFT